MFGKVVRRWPQLLTDFLTGYLDWFEGHKIVWMLSNQVMALYRASLVILFVGVLLLNLMALKRRQAARGKGKYGGVRKH